MNTLSRFVHFVDPVAAFLDNRMNPLLVRELRQLVRNRFIIVMLNLYIFLLVFVCLVQVGFTSDFTTATGERLFYTLTAVLGCSAFLVVVPYTALIAAMERINDDLMYTSGIRPGSIVFGKFLNGVILSLLLFSTTLPFYMLAAQLRGLDVNDALFIVWLVFLGLHVFNAFTLLLFTGVRSHVQLIFFGALLIGVAVAAFVNAPTAFSSVGAFVFPGWRECLVVTALATAAIAVCLSASIAN
ncbi:MAG TPA: hypothetical protein DEB39_05340, partial [Planctomycetaceae bacterium]|nr:hypothetical protein [Planctomycetaceae bacterium]